MSEFIINYAPAICGGLFTIAAIIISETGKIFIGSIIYLLADVVYLWFAILTDNGWGMVMLLSGLLFGIRTLLKMHTGLFRKTLRRE